MNLIKRFGYVTLAAAALMSAGQQVRAEEPLRVDVMAFNIRYGTAQDGENHWERRKELVFDVFRERGGDFVGVQEAMLFQIDELAEALPEYDHFGRSREEDPEKGEAVPIFYRSDRWRLDEDEHGTFWMSDTPDEPGSTHWGNDLPRVTTWGRFIEKETGRAVYVFNTHFDHRSQPSREKSSELITRRITDREHDDPVLVTGDFNAGEDNPAIRYLKGTEGDSPVKLVDTFRVLHEDATEVGTFGGWTGEKSGAKIDYVFALPDAGVIDAQIIHDNDDGRYPSDHYPVSAEVELPAE